MLNLTRLPARGRVCNTGWQRRTRRAQAEHVNDVMGLGEAVLGGDRPGPLLDGIRLDLYRRAATAADQVVVVASGGAGPEQALALLLQGVGVALGSQVGERTIDRGKADG